MKNKFLTLAMVLALVAGSTLTSCIGSFKLTNKLLTWNRNIDNKFVNELVFVAFWILPVYEVSGLADLLVINSIEFWSGSNPIAKGKRVIEGENGRYLVECDGKGYTITGPDGVVTRLDFNADTREWSTVIDGERIVFLAFIDDSHVKVPTNDGRMMVVELSRNGLYAYKSHATEMFVAER
ncbi:MAG: DUF3332 domain-containing protein [Bacteroidales bacterium]|nr:DUF3332 domain-containing protein [Bacteroidales bacterium]